MKCSSNFDGPRNLNSSWPLYLNFPKMINPYPNIYFIKNSKKCQQFLFWKKSYQKTQDSCFLKFRYAVMGPPIDMNNDVFRVTKKCSFATFLKI